MRLQPGNYFVISAVIDKEIMFLKDEGNLWSRTLREAKFYGKPEPAEQAKREARKQFSKFTVKSMQVLSIDIFGKSQNLVNLA
jgi:hypothetical protein